MPRRHIVDAIVRVRADTAQAQRGIRQMGRGWQAMTQWTQRLRAGALGMNNMLMGTGAVMVGAGLAARSAVRNYEQYSRSQARLRGIMVSANIPLNRQHYLMQSADVSSRRFGYGMAETAESMATLLETGIRSDEAMRYFGVASEFARASNTDLEASMRVVVDLMRQFNDQSEDGAERLAATINTASRITATSVSEMQQSLRYAGVEMSALGYNASETAAALGAMSQIGLRGTTAGTRMRGAILALHRITNRARDTMREYGLEHERLDTIIYDEQGNLRPFIEATHQLQGIMEDLPTSLARNTLATYLFGRRAFAAGTVISGLHAQSRAFNTTLEALSNTERNVTNMHRAAETQMHSFAGQIDLAKRAAQELGITFMEMLLGTQEGHHTFGQWLTDLSLAVRGADQNAHMTAIMRQQYERLSPEMRQSGRETREMIQGLVELLRLMARIGSAVGWLVRQNPQLAASLFLVASAVRPLIPLLLQMNAAQLATVRSGAALTTGMRGLGTQAGLVRASMWALIIDLGGRGSQVLTSQIASWLGLSDALRQVDNNLPPIIRDLSHIPVVGPWIQQISRLVELYTQARQEFLHEQDRAARQEREREAVRQAAVGRSREDAARSAERTYTSDLRELASSLYYENVRGQEAIAGALALRSGARVEEVQQMAQQLAAFQQEGGGGYTVPASRSSFNELLSGVGVMPIANAFGYNPQQAQTAEIYNRMRTDYRRMRQFSMEDDSVAMAASGRGGPLITGPESGRSSEYGVPQTDVEDLIGAMQNAWEQFSQLPPTQATPTVVQFDPQISMEPLEAQFTIPVTIDGREVGRAVGRYSTEVEQRRGGPSSPGDRRRVAQSGVR